MRVAAAPKSLFIAGLLVVGLALLDLFVLVNGRGHAQPVAAWVVLRLLARTGAAMSPESRLVLPAAICLAAVSAFVASVGLRRVSERPLDRKATPDAPSPPASPYALPARVAVALAAAARARK